MDGCEKGRGAAGMCAASNLLCHSCRCVEVTGWCATTNKHTAPPLPAPLRPSQPQPCTDTVAARLIAEFHCRAQNCSARGSGSKHNSTMALQAPHQQLAGRGTRSSSSSSRSAFKPSAFSASRRPLVCRAAANQQQVLTAHALCLRVRVCGRRESCTAIDQKRTHHRPPPSACLSLCPPVL